MIDWQAEIADVRSQLNDAGRFDTAVLARYDGERARTHEMLRARGIGPGSSQFERVWLVAGAVVAELLADGRSIDLLTDKDAHERASAVATAFWLSGLSAHPAGEIAS
jgi:hypothetical protein